ncbi:cytochrome P450 [Xylariales sp. PMI_506]|nr:cytochrome P450 [Xylariales sp. PMI_506]
MEFKIVVEGFAHIVNQALSLNGGCFNFGVTVTSIILGFLFTRALWRRFFSPLSDIPGPFLASISRLWIVKTTIGGKANIEFSKLHEKHGPFVRIKPGEVSICHPEAIKKLMLAPLRKGDYYKMATFPDWRFQNPMSELDPKRKVERSKAFASGFAASNILGAEDTVSRIVVQLLDRLDSYADRPGVAMPFDQYCTYFAFDVVGEMLCGKPFGFLREGCDIENAIATNLKFEAVASWANNLSELQYLLLNPLITWSGITPGSWLADRAAKWVGERVSRQQQGQVDRFDLLAHWLRYVEQNPDKATYRDAAAQATMVVGAGSDTASCAMQTLFYYMLRRPETLARAREEIDTNPQTPANSSDPSSGVVSWAVGSKLPYFQACIKEALRIHPPASLMLPRVAPAGGIKIGDRFFPAGTVLSLSAWVMHHARELWGDDVDEFRPERWLGDDAAELDKFWMPFGAGYMSCPGQHIARMELTKVCATIIRDYDFELADPHKEWEWKAYFSMVPYGWSIYVSKRKRE